MGTSWGWALTRDTQHDGTYLLIITCDLGSAFMQLMNIIRNSEGDAKAQVVVPPGLKSIRSSIKLQVILYNQQAETVQYYWVDFNGNHVLYGSVSPGSSAVLLTYGTHPWLIIKINGDLITYFVPETSNLEITVK